VVLLYLTARQDLDFPGVIARPMGSFNGKADYHYQCIRCNIDLLKMIQLGITMFSEDGDTPPASMSVSELGIDTTQKEFKAYAAGVVPIPMAWQFNFKFSLKEDMYSELAIENLRQGGLDFQRLDAEGIDPFQFGALLVSSGLVCDEDVHWISFHGGYDFGYLIKLLHVLPLPNDEDKYNDVVEKFFPSLYDLKYLLKYAISRQAMGQLTPMDPGSAEILAKYEQKSGLDNLAETLKLKRQGTSHQAGSNQVGSDSLLTGRIFFKIRERIFNGEISEEHEGKVWGFSQADSVVQPSNILSTPQHYNQQQLQENVTPGQNGYQNGGPSTPNTGNAHLANTPGHNSNGGMGPLTPGGAGGVFGAFSYNNK